MSDQTMANDLLLTRAMFVPETVNAEARTVDVIWSTGAQVKRGDWNGDYIEELSLQEGHVRLERLNAGAPFLASHENWSLRSVLGVVERAWLSGGQGRATVRFSKREDVEPFFQDVKDGILRNVSVGYRKHKTERDETGQIPVVRAVDWEPFEISLVPIPADAGAQVRSDSMNHDQKDSSMAEENKGSPGADQTTTSATEGVTDTNVETRAASTSTAGVGFGGDAQTAEQIRRAEQRRTSDIMERCWAAGLDLEFAQGLITSGATAEAARDAIIDAMVESRKSQPQTFHGRIEVGQEHGEKRFEAMRSALEARSNIGKWEDGGAREYVGATLLDMARECVERSGTSTRGMSKSEVATRAMHSTTDFPLLMTSIQRVTLKAAYAEERQTWQIMARREDLPDFREMSTIEVGGSIIPEELKEGGEYKAGTIKEAKGGWRISEYGNKIVVGRRLIINDNLGYITSAVRIQGRGVAILEANMVWSLLTTGSLGATCTMDGKALFHAEHNNTGTGAIGEASISDARQKMRNQKSFDGTTLYVEPRYILLPTVLETAFDKFNTTIVPNQTSNVNIFSGYLQKVVEPRLDAKSTSQFYIVGDYAGVDKVVYGYLQGEGGPSIEQVSGRDPDGITSYLRHDFGCHVPQHQAFFRSTGQ